MFLHISDSAWASKLNAICMVFLWERGCNSPQRLEVKEKSYPYGMEGRDDKTLPKGWKCQNCFNIFFETIPTGWIFMSNHTLPNGLKSKFFIDTIYSINDTFLPMAGSPENMVKRMQNFPKAGNPERAFQQDGIQKIFKVFLIYS